jgi:hypothetical protein
VDELTASERDVVRALTPHAVILSGGGWESGACAAPLDEPDEDAGALLAELNARVEALLAAKRAGGAS